MVRQGIDNQKTSKPLSTSGEMPIQDIHFAHSFGGCVRRCRWGRPANCTGTEEGKVSDVACSQATPWPSPLGLPRETKGPCQVHGVRDEVLQGVPQYPRRRIQIPWTNVNEWGLEDKRGGEQVLDAEVQPELPTPRETEAPVLHEALLDGHC